jgi:hypothetical protein
MTHPWLYIAVLSISFLISACAGSGEIRRTEVPENFALSLERTPCFGRCPTYALSLDAKGKVAYEALRFAPDSSEVHRKLTKSKMKKLVFLLKEADLTQYEDRYHAEISDLPAVILQCELDEMSKNIYMRQQVPTRLDSLIVDLEALIFKKKPSS